MLFYIIQSLIEKMVKVSGYNITIFVFKKILIKYLGIGNNVFYTIDIFFHIDAFRTK